MANWCRIFGLLMYKNLLVRKRHWKMTLFVQAAIPIALFVLMQAVRDFLAKPPEKIETNTYNSVETEEDLIDGSIINLYYLPDTKYTRTIIEETRQCLKIPDEYITGFNTEKELLDIYTKDQASEPYSPVLAVVFDDPNGTKSNMKYKIKHSSFFPKDLYQDPAEERKNAAYYLYTYKIPFIQLQICLDKALINYTAPGSLLNTEISIQEMPYPPYVRIDEADTIVREIMCMFAVIAFIIPLCIEANFGAKEKFIGVNVLMEMNGVKVYQNLFSWLITGVIFSTLYVIPIIVLFENTFTTNVDPYLYYGNAFIFWLLLTTHVAHLISFGMHVAAYFSKPSFVITTLSVIYGASFSLHGNMVQGQCFTPLPYLGILFPNILLYRLLEELNAYEAKLIGIQWKNLFITGTPEYGALGSPGVIFIFSIIGLILHFTLAVYINAIRPGKYGVQKELLYFLKCGRKNKIFLDEEAGDFDYDKVDNEQFEVVSSGILTPGIQIRDLKKTYRTSIFRKSTVQALKGVSVDLYKGQITALLGHNGAGKTTLMSILTGVISETAGKVFINGKNIKSEMESIRYDLGLCPQENMVFPDLSVIEQIEFFGMLKRGHKTRNQIKHEANILISKLKLSDKKYTLPDKLSGGQKRRLCLGMALIGDASTLILDEPTSGMDPETRRDTWDILLKMRGEKTILISTHNMEEADILGDRIAIVHAGRLKSYGTSMFLKKQYGHGHIEVTLSTKSWCNSDKIINKFDKRARPITIESEKIVLSVPYSDSLPESLDVIENEKKQLGVTGTSVSLITLEQVFLKIVEKENGKHLDELFMPLTQKLRGWKACLQAMLGLFEKKLTYTRKNPFNLLMIIFFPIISVSLMALSSNVPKDKMETHPLTLDLYRETKAFYYSDNATIGQKYKKSIEAFGAEAVSVPLNTSLTAALLQFSIEDIAEYRNDFIVSAEFNISENIMSANGFYSGLATDSIPLTINYLANALIKTFAGDSYSIELSRQQLPSSLASTQVAIPEGESIARVLIFCTFFFPTVALFIIHPLQEASSKIKQLQRMTGVSSVMYWTTMLLFDLLVFSICVGCIITALYVMDVVLQIRLYQEVELLTLTLLLYLFGINALLITYIFSFTNKSKNTNITILSVGPLGLVIVQYLLHNVLYSISRMKLLHLFQKGLFRLIPYVSFFHAQFSFYGVAIQNARCRRLPDRLNQVVCLARDICCDLECSNGTCKNPLPYFNGFDNDMSMDTNVLYLGLTPILYFTLLIMLEEKFFSKLIAKVFGSKLRSGCEVMDEQVKKEKHAVAVEINKYKNMGKMGHGRTLKTDSIDHSNILQSPESENANLFLVHELSKHYGKVAAVREVNFRVKQCECFGLLGVNGAGKSTTFRMLTGEEIPNSGTMYLGQAEIHSNRREYLSQMGYCPQTDALLNSLNAFDHLRLFARLRGIPQAKVELEVNKWINRLNLNACMNQPSGTYSGGNKRRLNIAMALIGNPVLVLMDEPTTGVDPAARRSLWTVLQSCQAAGQSIILTSHSMEECEALCNRLVIMVNGQLVCIGPSQELKQRFGAGYDINIKLNPARSNEDVQEIKRLIEQSLACEIRDENLGFIGYHVTDSQTTWKNMYNTMNDLKRRYSCIEDFAVLSATLEQLFIQFARGINVTADEESVKSPSSPAIPV